MQLKSYSWMEDNNLIGGATIECNCGNIFEKEYINCEDAVECPICHMKEWLHIKTYFIFKEVKRKF